MTGLRVFLAGDVMTGRGIDQLFARSVDPRLHEPYVKDARDYLRLAEGVAGAIERPVAPAYPWGDALEVLRDAAPDLRLINLETAVTAGGEPWPGKGIHYRMHPVNTDCLRALAPDAAVLANNHVLDWGHAGLRDSLEALNAAGIARVGAGRGAREAAEPAMLAARAGRTRLALFGACLTDSGVPAEWGATSLGAGVCLLDPDDVAPLCEAVSRSKRSATAVVVSIHWGGNWGYAVPDAHRRLAQALIDAGADLVHGHSAHHRKGVELYRGRLILYGCGDFVNDYEGIGGHQNFRPDLVCGWLVDLAPDGTLARLAVPVFRPHRLRLERAADTDARWLADLLSRESEPAAVHFRAERGPTLVLDTGAGG